MNKRFRIAPRLPMKLEEIGVRISPILGRAGLPQDLFDQPRALVTTEELFAFWRAVGELCPDASVGLTLGTEGRIEHFDAIGLAALSTRTLGEAVRQMARYKQLSCPEEILTSMEGDEWRLRFFWLLADEAEPEVLTDLCFAWLLSIARHGTGTRLNPLRVEYVRQRSYRRELERYFGCPVVFGASQNALVFRASDAARPFITRNAELLSMLAPQFEEALREHEGQQPFTDRVRTTIQRKLTGRRPKIQEIAREMHLSSRTLQRRLQDSGSSFQQVLEEARHQLARYYLANSVLELSEAAYLLGYEDANSFVRAFRTWEGVPPAHWRENQRAAVAAMSA